MLKVLKVEAYPVLVSNLTRGEIINELPSPWYFDHILIMARVEGEKFFLDPVSEFIPFGELTPQMQNRPALLILKNKGKLIKTPDTLAYQNQEEVIIEGKLTENGDLNQTVEVREYGNNALTFKELFSLFKNKEQIYFIFSKLAGYFFGNAELYETYISNIEEINFPFRFNFHSYTKKYAQNTADLYYFRLPIFSSFKMFSLVRQHPLERLTPLVLGSNGQIDKRIHLILPKGFKVKAFPSVTYLKNSVGTFQLTYYQEGDDLWYYSRLIINPSIVPPSQYKDLKSLIETSYQLEDEIVLLEKDKS
ncbi:MAG: hypothetical protein HYU63_01115 [Armatimonadetes bacterium]|nr:hypothetical protein [Armatimonadota bacterium]